MSYSYYLIFPGFVIWNLSVLLGLVNQENFSYIGVVSAGVIIIDILKITLIERKINVYQLYAYTTILSIFSLVCIRLIVSNLETYIYNYLVYLIIGLAIFISLVRCNSFNYFSHLNFFILITILTLIIVLYQGELVELLGQINTDKVATYQGYGRVIILMSAIAFFTTINPILKISIAGLTLFTLFLLGGRSEFWLYLGALILTLTWVSSMSNKLNYFSVKFFSVFIFSILLFSYFLLSLWHDLFENSRIFSILNLLDVYENEGRGELTLLALKNINDNIIFGNIGLMAPGENSHNILSAFVDWGIFIFIILIIFSFISLIYSLKLVKKINSPLNSLMVYFSIFWFIGSISSYWYLSEYLFILIAFLVISQRDKLLRC
jgi:hypothetical protein